MTKQAKHNGWSNYETWLVALWMDNARDSYRYWRDWADVTWSLAGQEAANQPWPSLTRFERARNGLAQQLKKELTERSPVRNHSLYADLLSSALAEVDCHEIAAEWLRELPGVEQSASVDEGETP